MTDERTYDLIIAGGGACGLFAARRAAQAGLTVLVLEKKERTGKKILITGNGRCNVSNLTVSADSYPAPMRKFTAPALDALSVKALMQEFSAIGVPLVSRGDCLYPRSGQAAAVADALVLAAREAGATFQTESAVRSVRRTGHGFRVTAGENSISFFSKAVLLACGLKAAPRTGSDGSGIALAASLNLPVNPVLPALTPLLCDEPYAGVWAGVRTHARVTVCCGNERAQDTGEIQLTDFGISGIPVFQVSRLAVKALACHRRLRVHLDFLPEYTREDLLPIAGRLSTCADRNIVQLLQGMRPRKLVQTLARRLDISEKAHTGELGEKAVLAMLALAKDFPVHVTGYKDFSQAQVCQGGVAREAVDPQTMMAVNVPGLFLAGEILDVDGPCGGFNLHWAWASGNLAAKGAAHYVKGKES
ncbi:MAG: aminoacetone oxidase family FAD-binding enzyme [Lachnospira sp.]|nr:aminoacetone oxidase family FAD-binding enzyme [Lachnospira sp.]